MRSRGLIASVFALLFVGALHADDAKDILNMAVKAQGGPSNAAKLRNTFLKGKSSITDGGNGLSLAFEISIQGLDKAKMELEINSMFHLTVGLNGDKSWRFDPRLNKTEEGKKEETALVRQFLMTLRAAASPASISGKDLQLAHGGEAKVNDAEAVILRISQKDQPDISLFYDKKTGLPLKAETRLKEPNGRTEANFEFFFSDFKEIDGIKYFAKLKFAREGKDIAEVELSDFKVDQKFEASTFEKP
jgi:outer membrane lipoprotein-sorting protein